MSNDVCKLEAYWGSRQELAEACAARFAQMATGLARTDPVFDQWLRQAGSRAEANKRFCNMPPDVDELTRIFDAGRSYRGQPPVLWPELGFFIGAWNGQDERRHGAAMMVHPGAYDDIRPNANHVNISMGSRRLRDDQPWTGSMLKPVLLAVVEAWKPSFAVVLTGRHATLIVEKAPKNWSAPGWLTYLAFPYSLQMTPPDGVKVERFAGGDLHGGLLATLCEEPFDVDNPHHMALAAEMQKAITPVQW